MKKLIVGSLTALALLSGCGEQTRCGMYYVGAEDGQPLNEGWDFESIQTVEDRVIDSFSRIVRQPGFDSSSVCSSLDGVVLQIKRTARWTISDGRLASGEFDCNKLMLVGQHADGPRMSSIAHEIAHVVQKCVSPLPIDLNRDAEHSNWTRDGIVEAISDSQAVR